MSTFVTGDSQSVHGLVLDLYRPRAADYLVKRTAANRELECQLLPDGQLPALDDVAGLFPARPGAVDVPFLPRDRLLSRAEKQEAARGFDEVLTSGMFTSGPHITEFENALSEFMDVGHVVATSCGTDALILALKAVGVGVGDEVVMPANSFAATENAVFMCGALPVLVDVDPLTANLDPSAADAAVNQRTRAILAVHKHGKLCDMTTLAKVAHAHNVSLIEDACQAIGVTGVARHSDAAVLSFNPAKTLGLCGKAGALLTGSPSIAALARTMANHGFEPGRKNVKIAQYGYNCMIDNASASIGLRLLPYLALNNFKRAYLARRYEIALRESAESARIQLLPYTSDNAFALYPIFLEDESDRDRFQRRLMESFKVETELNYPLLTSQQDTEFARRHFAGQKLPHTKSVNSRGVCLPLFNNMSLSEQDQVIAATRLALK